MHAHCSMLAKTWYNLNDLKKMSAFHYLIKTWYQGSFFWLQNTEGEPLVGVFATNTNHSFSLLILQPEKRTLHGII
jgi:hypothetical protein